jgi:hypothetical protein
MVALLKMPSQRDANSSSESEWHDSYKFNAAPLGFERRVFERKEVRMRVEARRHDHSIDARRQPHVSFAMRDLSLGGCSALSDMPLSAGERVSLFFPPTGPNRGWDAYGRVVRCNPSATGYRVAVAFDSLPAA